MVKRNAGRMFTVVVMLLMAAGVCIAWMGQRSRMIVQASGAGSPLANMSPSETTLFLSGQTTFNLKWDPFRGLGPVFTQPNCNLCHASPVPGGSSAGSTGFTLPNHATNTDFGKLNSDGSFNPLTNEGGPFQQGNSNQQDLKGCVLNPEVIPADATIVAHRTSPATFGDGLIDAIPDATILANAVNQGLGIQGTANLVPDENGILRPGRFGRKDQEPDLLMFVGNAMVHELGITNPINPNDDNPQGIPAPVQCDGAHTHPNDLTGANLIKFLHFEQFLAPNPPATLSASGLAGKATFESIGCNKCHVETMTTASTVKVLTNVTGGSFNDTKALANQAVALYSDLLLHNMGPGLADGMVFGNSTGSQFRTEPLWGLSLRTVYLHDGRATTLTSAITAHGGEAATVISSFNALSSTDQANLITFLNSL